MGKPVFLLGAGASIDAGLADSNTLTKRIYDILATRHVREPVKVYGYVIAKIMAKKVREGGSPFDPVNVEEVYEGIESLIHRQSRISSEFVSSWDAFIDDLTPRFDEHAFSKALQKLFQFRNSRAGQVSIITDSFSLRSVVAEIKNATTRSGISGDSRILLELLSALVNCLVHDPTKMQYAIDMARICSDRGGIFASLNYDVVMESAIERVGLSHDYGLLSWDAKKLVEFRRSKDTLKLMKMHGSVNWYAHGDNINVSDHREIFEQSSKSIANFRVPQMIFGGDGSKLRPDGPFLQLRHEFEREILKTNTLVIVGYSFSDTHLNAIIRRWTSTRRKAKLVVVDPNHRRDWLKKIGMPLTVKDGKIERRTVDLVHIMKSAANAVSDIASEIDGPIDLSIEKNRSGALPDVFVRGIS